MTATPMHKEDLTDLIVGGATIVFAFVALFGLIPYGIDNPGSIDVLALGPSFWPTIICGLLLLMGIIISVQAFRRSRARQGSDEGTAAEFATARWIGSLVLLAGLYGGLHYLGMVLTCIIALVLFMLLGGERRPLIIVAISLVLPLALFAFFRYVANVVIPLGVLEPWLG